MKVLSIGTDRKIFEEGSPVRARMVEYGKLFDELHIIIFTRKSTSFKQEQMSDNVWIYPTRSFSRLRYMRDAQKKAEQVIHWRTLNELNTVVTTQDPFETGHVGKNIQKKHGFAFQVQVHTDLFSPYFRKTSLLNRLRFYMAKKILPLAQEIRVVSPRIKRSLIDHLSISADKIDVLPIYIAKNPARDQAQTFTREKHDQFMFTLLMVGRFAFEKNIPFALEIMSEVLKKYPKAGLMIVGEGPEKLFLQQKVRELGIEKAVQFEPWQTDLEPYYKRSQAFLHTSFYEGYGLVLIEAALHRLPIITSDVGIAGDVLKDGESACVCPINNKHQFIQKIFHVIENNSFRMKIASAAFEIAQASVIPKEEYLKQYAMLLVKAYNNI